MRTVVINYRVSSNDTESGMMPRLLLLALLFGLMRVSFTSAAAMDRADAEDTTRLSGIRLFFPQEKSPRRHTDFASTLCPPSMTRISCFNMLTNLWLTLNHDRLALAISRPHNKRSLAVLSACPPGVAAEWCYQKADDISAAAATYKKNKIDWSPCPDTGNKLGCFEQYMSMLIAAAPRQPPGQQRRRRRSALFQPSSSAQIFCHTGEDTLQCYAKVLRMYAHQVSRQQRATVVTRRSHNPTRRGGGDAERAMPSIAQLCAPSTDSMACFEYYLTMYARMTKNAGGKKSFIGRDLSNIDSRME